MSCSSVKRQRHVEVPAGCPRTASGLLATSPSAAASAAPALQNPRRPHRAQLVFRHVGPPVFNGSSRTLPSAGNGAHHQKHRSAGKVCCHPQAWHDEEAHPAGDRGPAPWRGDCQRLAAPMTRRRESRRPSWPDLCQAAPAWYTLELQEVLHVCEGALPSWVAARQHALSAQTASWTSTRCPVGASGGEGPPRRETSSAAGQRKGGHDVHGRLQHGPWPAGLAGADGARGHDRRRLLRAVLIRAQSSRHVRERLGNDVHNPAAHGRPGRCDAPKQRRTSVDPSLGHGQHLGQRGHPDCSPSRHAVLHFTTKHVVLASLRRGRLELQELHLDASEHRTCTCSLRWLTRRHRDEQGMAAPAFGRMGISRRHGPMREEPSVDNWEALRGRTQRRRAPRCRGGDLGTVTEATSRSAKHDELEPAPEDPVGWAMTKLSDDADDAPLTRQHQLKPEPQLIYIPLPLSALPISNWCAARRLVCDAGACWGSKQNDHLHLILNVFPLSRVSVVSCVVPTSCVSTSWT